MPLTVDPEVSLGAVVEIRRSLDSTKYPNLINRCHKLLSDETTPQYLRGFSHLILAANTSENTAQHARDAMTAFSTFLLTYPQDIGANEGMNKARVLLADFLNSGILDQEPAEEEPSEATLERLGLGTILPNSYTLSQAPPLETPWSDAGNQEHRRSDFEVTTEVLGTRKLNDEAQGTAEINHGRSSLYQSTIFEFDMEMV